MASYNTTWRNKAWIAWFALQVPLIFFIDFLELFWPAWLYEPAGAPLHGAFVVKQDYIRDYNDPISQWSAETASSHNSWMGLFLQFELFFLLPTTLYGLYRLAVQRRGTSGADELLFFAYAFLLSFTSLVCMHHTYYLDSAVYPEEIKRKLRFQFYGPWLYVPTLGAIDMASRILGRIRSADAVLGARKAL